MTNLELTRDESIVLRRYMKTESLTKGDLDLLTVVIQKIDALDFDKIE